MDLLTHCLIFFNICVHAAPLLRVQLCECRYEVDPMACRVDQFEDSRNDQSYDVHRRRRLYSSEDDIPKWKGT